jgi:hypothetical protein
MKNQFKAHQGDVIVFAAELPEGAVKIANKPVAYGEHSGHQHVITGDVEIMEYEGHTFAKVGSGRARLQHVHEANFRNSDFVSLKELQKADHGSILLEEGVYEVVIQNNYNPYKRLMEKVID